jgi:hypothetical protein
MKLSTFFLLSVFSAVIALGLQIAARGQIYEGAHRRAKSLEAAALQHVKAEPDAEADRHSRIGQTLCYIGLAFTVCGFICFITARYHRESGWYLILAGLLLLGILTPLLL